MDFAELLDPAAWGALASVVTIDLVLAGDNAVVVGLAAGGLPRAEQRRVIAAGIAVATVLRVALALVTQRLLAIVGLALTGGLLLLWVAWKTYRELAATRGAAPAQGHPAMPRRSFRQALLRVVLADVSMSLDNILAVAGSARNHLWVLVIGLLLSIALMGAASTVIARILDRHPRIAWLGLAVVTIVALRLVYDGSAEIWARF